MTSSRMLFYQLPPEKDAVAGDADLSDESSVTFPPTYIVVRFSPNLNPKALAWFVNKIKGKRKDGGAELLVSRQPQNSSQGTTIHVSASKIKILEIAEELELRKYDRSGLVREFIVTQLDDFLEDGMHIDDLFTTAERMTIVRHELENIRALPEDDHVPHYPWIRLYQGQSIFQIFVKYGFIRQCYPLHDKDALKKLGAKWYLTLLRRQPYEEIRLYFGENVALYFIFLGFYTMALIPPAVLGLLELFIPQTTTVFFCIFHVIWVTLFLELWKRKSNELAFNWGTISMTSLDEPRPEFTGVMGVDEVTGRYQPKFPRWKTNAKIYCVSLPIVFVCIAIAFIIMLVSFRLEAEIIQDRKNAGDESLFAKVVIMIPSVTYAGLVYIMNVYYRKFATYLTEWENHRTQSQFDRHRVTKLIMFEFTNNFMSMFYIAFIIQDMDMLKFQLATMLIILQAINNFQETVLPLLIRCYGTKVASYFTYERLFSKSSSSESLRKGDNDDDGNSEVFKSIAELEPDDPRIRQSDAESLMDSYEGTYDDYLELFIQFGYVFLFSSVYPMAAFWAVANNVLEIRGDAFKLCKVCQRPMPRRVKDIGAWQKAFEAVGALSVMTNCGLMCISPQLRDVALSMSPVEWVLGFVFLEHFLLGIRYILNETISDKPEWVRVALAKINYQSKQALKNERILKNRRHLSKKLRSRTHTSE